MNCLTMREEKLRDDVGDALRLDTKAGVGLLVAYWFTTSFHRSIALLPYYYCSVTPLLYFSVALLPYYSLLHCSIVLLF